jgi:hypothetical protein
VRIRDRAVGRDVRRLLGLADASGRGGKLRGKLRRERFGIERDRLRNERWEHERRQRVQQRRRLGNEQLGDHRERKQLGRRIGERLEQRGLDERRVPSSRSPLER